MEGQGSREVEHQTKHQGTQKEPGEEKGQGKQEPLEKEEEATPGWVGTVLDHDTQREQGS